jgi:hypothetical protein
MEIATTTINSTNENPLGTDLSAPSQPIRFKGIFVGPHVLRVTLAGVTWQRYLQGWQPVLTALTVKFG